MRIIWTIVLLFCFIGGSTAHAENAPVGPPEGVTEVSVGLYLIDINFIRASDQTFSVLTYVRERWKDPRLASTQPRRTLPPGAIWEPALEFVNAQDLVKQVDEGFIVDPDGTVTHRIRLKPLFNSSFDFSRFPFDSTTLGVTLRCQPFDASRVKLAIDPKFTGYNENTLFDAEWSLARVVGSTDRSAVAPDEPEQVTLTYSLRIDRKYSYYLYGLFLPMLLMVIASFSLFFMKAPNLQMSLTVILGLVVYKLALSSSLPRISYTTYTDAFFLSCLITVFLVHISSTWLLRLSESGSPLLESRRRLLLGLVPLVFLAGQIGMYFSFFK